MSADTALPLALVVPGGADELAPALSRVWADARLELRGVELLAGGTGVRGALAALDAALPRDIPAYVELRLDGHVGGGVEMVAAAGHRVKLRTGGTVPEAFPSSAALAAALTASVHCSVAFKLTAGLHHGVRYRDPVTGFEHHGLLNVLAAVEAALGGRGADDVPGGSRSATPRRCSAGSSPSMSNAPASCASGSAALARAAPSSR